MAVTPMLASLLQSAFAAVGILALCLLSVGFLAGVWLRQEVYRVIRPRKWRPVDEVDDAGCP